jgi:cytochrome P450
VRQCTNGPCHDRRVRARTAGWKHEGGPVEFFGADALQDPYPLYDRMRAGGPVHRIGDSGFYAVCSWDAINGAIGRPEDSPRT